ncbi:hypothetical protein [Kingella kingae]|uniref:hypothetical protein n=1 Tax=Kingella kingae TaxID=504 RepID=UPI0025521AF8|nr:hypothetical protein [Kingella kingae]MDK4624194.1 hypothetical protein [Kingella kingae]MDK4659773.1 hypothetical protein [Kingella kingae]MDK4667765.1 hypothetical protein [Kingella kingae]MDK4686127.1 hypothetical protein [Kingella kingae]
METALIILVTLIVILGVFAVGESLVGFMRKTKLKDQKKIQEQQDAEQQKQAEIAVWQAELHEEANEKRRLKRECQAKLAAENAAKCQTLKRKAEIAAWQADLHEKANEKRRLEHEHIARVAAENAAKCQTLSGFLSERQKCYTYVLSKVDAYAITSARRRLDPNERTEQIIWQSLETVFDSTNAKTMQSRIELVRNHAAKLIRSPIDEHMFRIIATHYYLVQINALEEKIANYKTQAAKNKAQSKIEQLFVQALNDNAVYQQAVLEYQKSMNEPDRLSLSDETLADNEKMP